jgi:hypothetical protein
MSKKKVKLPLSKTHPELAKEAMGWNPNQIVAGSHKRVEWLCPKGHTFIAAVQDRTRRGDNCSICAGKQVLIGFNDLKSLFPEVASQAFGWNPEEFTVGSGKKKDWKCEFGHVWSSVIASRTGKDKTGCGVCNGKQVIAGVNDLKTFFPDIAAEAQGWDPTKVTSGSGKKLSWVCKYGHEWDATVADRTSRGDKCPVCSGRKVLAGFNDLQSTHPDLAVQANGWNPTSVTYGSGQSKEWKCSEGHIWPATIASRTNMNSGCPFCSGNQVIKGENDLATTHPEIATELLELDPREYSFGSHKQAKWRCKKQHEYEMTIQARAKVLKCPICSGARVLAGFNDLKTTHPEVAELADGWDPTSLSSGSNKECNWICDKQHKWVAPIYSLTGMGTRCPICSGQRFEKGYNDLSTTYPQIANEAFGWDPSEIGASSDKRLQWKCPVGHIYDAYVYNRTLRGDQCSICSGRQVLAGFNDLATTNPSVAAQAVNWDPTTVTAGSNIKFRWRCEEGHEWTATVGSRTGSHQTGCPTCAKTGYDPNENGWLYFLHHESWELFQIGITNDPDRRTGQHKKLGWEVLEIRGPMDGHLAQQWETAILRMLKAKGADLSNSKIAGKFDGYSEAWSKSTFHVKSIKGLMQLTEDFEEE